MITIDFLITQYKKKKNNNYSNYKHFDNMTGTIYRNRLPWGYASEKKSLGTNTLEITRRPSVRMQQLGSHLTDFHEI
jgi:hypothetical protein